MRKDQAEQGGHDDGDQSGTHAGYRHKDNRRPETDQAEAPKAVRQFRTRGCSDWYDGLPDREDGGGPYETRTLYTAPVPAQAEAPKADVAKLIREYRPSMPADVMHLWAKDLVAVLSSLAMRHSVAWRWRDDDYRWQATCDEDRASYEFRVNGREIEDLFSSATPVPAQAVVDALEEAAQVARREWLNTENGDVEQACLRIEDGIRKIRAAALSPRNPTGE